VLRKLLVTRRRIKLVLATAPVLIWLCLLIESRLRLFLKFGEWFLPQVWMVDLTVWLFAPLVYMIRNENSVRWKNNLRLIYWIAFGVLTFLYGSIFLFITIDIMN